MPRSASPPNPSLSPSDTPPPPDRGFTPALLWACFLGCSWTWVIGMLLPALLLRDYGVLGWVAFALPNVAGAAAFGFVLARPRNSQLFVQEHAAACHAFSHATVAFHLFVAAWLLAPMLGFPAMIMLVIGLGVAAGLGLRNPNTAMLGVAVGLTLLSLGAFSYVLRLTDAWTGVPGLSETTLTPRLSQTDLLLLVPALVAGFALCPYLDLTFHRARQNTDAPTGKAAFTLGFVGVFFSMIVFSLAYAGKLIPAFAGESPALSNLWVALLAIHLPFQIAFTLVIHSREAVESPGAKPHFLLAAAFVGILLGAAARGLPDVQITTTQGPITLAETVYRALLLLYATVFPAYVFLVAWPTRKPTARATRNAAFVIAAALTYPAAVAAFILGHTWLILPALALLLIIRLLLPALNRKP